MTELDEAMPQPRRARRPALLIVALVLIAVAAVAAASVMLRHHADQPAKGELTVQKVTTPPASAGDASPAAAGPAGKKPASPLPVLVAGSPFDDDSFAQVSAEVVIAALGLKQDKDWQANVLAYMGQVLDKRGLTVEQYNSYAKALYDNPDRGRAVAENIQQRVAKKLGHRADLKALPMFKFDKSAVNDLQKKLEK
jgi:hypothetical protein